MIALLGSKVLILHTPHRLFLNLGFLFDLYDSKSVLEVFEGEFLLVGKQSINEALVLPFLLSELVLKTTILEI